MSEKKSISLFSGVFSQKFKDGVYARRAFASNYKRVTALVFNRLFFVLDACSRLITAKATRFSLGLSEGLAAEGRSLALYLRANFAGETESFNSCIDELT